MRVRKTTGPRGRDRCNDQGHWLCTKCQVHLPEDRFYTGRGGPKSICKSCDNRRAVYQRKVRQWKAL